METSTTSKLSNNGSSGEEPWRIIVGRDELKQTVCLLACSLGESEVNQKDEAILDAIHRLNRIIAQGEKVHKLSSLAMMDSPAVSLQNTNSHMQSPDSDLVDSPTSDIVAEELPGQPPNPSRPGVTMVARNGEISEEMLLESFNISDDTDLEDYYGISNDKTEKGQGGPVRARLSHNLNMSSSSAHGMLHGITYPLRFNAASRRKHERQTFTCFKCKERIVCVTNFEKHMMEAHSIAKPWECRFCPAGRRFHRLILLEHHYNTMHKNNGEGRRKYTQRQFLCDICHEIVTYVSKFEAHMLEKHGVRKPWRCDQCANYSAATYHLYMWHVQQYHPTITKHHLEISTVVNNMVNLDNAGQAISTAAVLAQQRGDVSSSIVSPQPTAQASPKNENNWKKPTVVSENRNENEQENCQTGKSGDVLLKLQENLEVHDDEESEEEMEADELPLDGQKQIELKFGSPDQQKLESLAGNCNTTPKSEDPELMGSPRVAQSVNLIVGQSNSNVSVSLDVGQPNDNVTVKQEPSWEDEASEDSGCHGDADTNQLVNGNQGHSTRRESVDMDEIGPLVDEDGGQLDYAQSYPRKYTIRSFMCEICGIEIRHTAKYERHMFEMHNVTMPYKCDKCSGRRFMRLIQLQVHEDKMHNRKSIETRRKWTQRQFQCPVCHEKITYVAKYQQHMILEHGVIRMFDCRVCGHAMGHYHQYQDHMRTYHPKENVRHYSETESLTNSGSQHSDEGS